MVRHTFCNRLLLAVIPSWLYSKDLTLQSVLGGLVSDLNKLQAEGVDASWVFKFMGSLGLLSLWGIKKNGT